MRHALVAAIVLAGLSACASKADDAEAQYRIVSRSGTLGERCTKAREVQAAYLAAHDEGRYSRWSLTASADCLAVDLYGSGAPADEKLRAQIARAVAKTTDTAVNTAAELTAAENNGEREDATSSDGAAILANAVPENLRRYQAEERVRAAADSNEAANASED